MHVCENELPDQRYGQQQVSRYISVLFPVHNQFRRSHESGAVREHVCALDIKDSYCGGPYCSNQNPRYAQKPTRYMLRGFFKPYLVLITFPRKYDIYTIYTSKYEVFVCLVRGFPFYFKIRTFSGPLPIFSISLKRRDSMPNVRLI